MWQIISCIGIVFLILEIVVPGLFFLNFAIAAFICAVLSLYIKSIAVLTVVFCVLSIILVYTLRPMLIKKNESKKQDSGIDAKYIGKTATVVENVDKNKGAISIYDERWQARNIEEGVIEEGSKVEITGHESIIMNVKKID